MKNINVAKTQTGFIVINSSVLDYDEYVRSVILLKNYLKSRLSDLILEEGFVLESQESPDYCSSESAFFNKEKDLEIRIIIRKKSKETFI
ncbi:MAG: hypothetical protein V1866_01715 [archaeon]